MEPPEFCYCRIVRSDVNDSDITTNGGQRGALAPSATSRGATLCQV